MSKKKAKPKPSQTKPPTTTSSTTTTATPSKNTTTDAHSQASDITPEVRVHTSTDKPISQPASTEEKDKSATSQSAVTTHGPSKRAIDASQKSKKQDQQPKEKEGSKPSNSPAKTPAADATNQTKPISAENANADSELPQEVSASLRSAPPQASPVRTAAPVDEKAPQMSEVDEVVGKLAAIRLQSIEQKVRTRIPGPFGLVYEVYDTELQLPLMQRLIEKDLSEPYSIFTYRYFLNNWPELCFLAMKDDVCVGTIICKLGLDKKGLNRGYIAMLAVDSSLRKMGIGSTLVKLCIAQMKSKQCDVVVLETELTNSGALALYEKLDFVRDKRLMRYYLNGVDAFRLKLWLTPPTGFC